MSNLAGLIFYVASLTGEPCETVFRDSAEAAVAPRIITEKKALREFSTIACQTSNPDLLWQMAFHESGFRFDIVSFNDGRKFITGKEARIYLATQKWQGDATPSVDVGVLQVNWRWHGEGFGKNATKMLSPTAQVRYIVDEMYGPLVGRCGNTKWVGCYHHWRGGEKAEAYSLRIDGARPVLAKSLYSRLKQVKGRIAAERFKVERLQR